MTKNRLIKISSYSGSIGLTLIVCSYMILDIELPWIKEISFGAQVLGFLLFGFFITIILYAYFAYKNERINDEKSF